ncbi:TetR/AcrR family transcriptional regulator [Notoacmeibacter sp. MSK16QG-6]|uniref:TetR/AcrR family transcriptional regulator n=1 Tax=Notoacmeibacter sp. MSK16QG-6 TaxID=2957982 RepID=UPI00209CD761|nr:TetR/AcrR family transcriptional regulator [Notoacmeibacter sp. MSK16QG-6]MCP1200867.1 TetR/AcrR family transcriptional regulator [Notoacmeibacter sp. MSK16QG-6]
MKTASPPPARDRILDAANSLFYAEGIRAVSVDAIAAKAGLTKKTLYYHFRSKDELVADYLASRDQPNLLLFEEWFTNAEGGLPRKVEAIFTQLAIAARHPKWRGCGFLRTAGELANLPGHPAMKVGAAHKKKFEAWIAGEFRNEGLHEPDALARHIVLLMDGAFSTMLVHRDPAYAESAGQAAKALVELALAAASRSRS